MNFFLDFYSFAQDTADSQWLNISDSAMDNVKFYLTVYGSLAVANSCFTFVRAFLFAYGGICAATVVHNSLLQRLLKVCACPHTHTHTHTQIREDT